MAAKSYRGIYAIKPWWQGRLSYLEALLIRKHVHPDLISLSGLFCAALLGLVLACSARVPLLVLLVAPLAIGRLAANALDGLVARKTGLARAWGEVFNECCDRLADTLIFVGLALNPLVLPYLAWSVLVLILLCSYLGTVAKAAGGTRQFGGFLAKADRMLYLAAFSYAVFFFSALAWNWLLLAFLAGLLLTIVQRYRWVHAELESV